MLILALEACAAVHAKALPPAPPDALSGLGLLDRLVEAGAVLLVTKGVHGEQVAMTLEGALHQWAAQGKLRQEAAPSRAVRTMMNRVPRRVPRPGRKDIALVCAAERAGAGWSADRSGRRRSRRRTVWRRW